MQYHRFLYSHHLLFNSIYINFPKILTQKLLFLECFISLSWLIIKAELGLVLKQFCWLSWACCWLPALKSLAFLSIRMLWCFPHPRHLSYSPKKKPERVNGLCSGYPGKVLVGVPEGGPLSGGPGVPHAAHSRIELCHPTTVHSWALQRAPPGNQI